jgi:HEAT repeat protein
MDQPREKLHVHSAEELFEALSSPKEAVRLSVLQAIAAYPQQALDFGPWNGEELVGRLMEDARRDPNPLMRSAIVKVVANFRGPRVLAFLMERVQASHDADMVMELETRLEVEPLDEIRPFLVEFLADDRARSAQALVAANMLSRDETLPPSLRLRVALLTNRDVPFPPLDPSTLDAWIDELGGPLQDRARDHAEEHGDAVLRLWSGWERLSERSRTWLAEWTSRRHPDTARVALAAVLDPDLGADSLRALLRCAATVGLDESTLDSSVAAALLTHPDAAVRAAALGAGLGEPDALVERLTDCQEAAPVRVAALRRLAGRETEGLMDLLIPVLGDPDWQVRAAAADALVARGEASVERLESVLHGCSKEARAAAARALVTLKGEEWLERALARVACA